MLLLLSRVGSSGSAAKEKKLLGARARGTKAPAECETGRVASTTYYCLTEECTWSLLPLPATALQPPPPTPMLQYLGGGGGVRSTQRRATFTTTSYAALNIMIGAATTAAGSSTTTTTTTSTHNKQNTQHSVLQGPAGSRPYAVVVTTTRTSNGCILLVALLLGSYSSRQY